MSETKQQVPAKISHNSNQKEIEVNSTTFCLCNNTNCLQSFVMPSRNTDQNYPLYLKLFECTEL